MLWKKDKSLTPAEDDMDNGGINSIGLSLDAGIRLH
jgi:hypothetical protein